MEYQKTHGKRIKYYLIIAVLTALSISGCGKTAEKTADSTSVAEPAAEAEVTQESTPDPIPDFTEANLAKIYDLKKTVTDPSDFSGEWQRTAVHSSCSADLLIENSDSEGFDFTGEFYYYYHTGDVAGRAYYVSQNMAVYRQLEEEDIDGEPAYIGFSIDDNGLHVISYGFVEGLGMNVYVYGDYVQDEPYYTNSMVLEENFTEDDLTKLKELLKEETYEDLFLNNTTTGNVTREEVKLSDGCIARHIECFVPTMGDGYDMLITEDGRYYFFNRNLDVFATNDADYNDWCLPEFTAVSDEAAYDDDKSPFVLWQYEGYVDECEGYYRQDEFMDCDYDSDGKKDRLLRKWNGDEQTALYTVEFGNGNILEVPQGWETGFPHVQGGDLDGDGEKEILVTLSYDTGTDPMSYGDMWLFHWDALTSEYKEVTLPLISGENGAKGFTIEYEKPEDLLVRYTIKEAGLSRSEEISDDYLNSWWTDEAASEFRSIYWAEIREGANPAVRCYVEPLPRGGASLGFDLSYRNGKYEIGYMELDSPDGPF